MSTPHESAQSLMQLFDLRREEKLREARTWVATSFNPQSVEDFAALTPGLIDHLHRQGVRLVGIDTPSIDPCTSKDLPAHKACLKNDMAILEGVVLDAVPEGLYELIALPLKLVGFDGSPVRAILRDLPR